MEVKKAILNPDTAVAKENVRRMWRMYQLDVLLLVVFAAMSWLVVIYIGSCMMALANTAALAGFISVLRFVILGVLSMSMYMVYVHLRQNRQEIYAEELYWQDQNKKSVVVKK